MNPNDDTKKHEIEIPDLPEGYIALAYRIPASPGELVMYSDGAVKKAGSLAHGVTHWLIVEKIKPRERKFVCVSETHRKAVEGEYYETIHGDLINCNKTQTDDEYPIWREVKEGA